MYTHNVKLDGETVSFGLGPVRNSGDNIYEQSLTRATDDYKGLRMEGFPISDARILLRALDAALCVHDSEQKTQSTLDTRPLVGVNERSFAEAEKDEQGDRYMTTQRPDRFEQE